MERTRLDRLADKDAVPSSSHTIAVASSYLDVVIRAVLLGYIVVLPFKALLVVERTGFLILLGLLIVWCLLNRKLFFVRTPFDASLLAFVFWVGFTILFSAFPAYSLKEYGKLLQWMVVFYSVIHFLGKPPYRPALVILLGVTALIVTGYGLTQFNLTNPQAVIGTFSAEVWFTTFLIMIIPFGLSAVFGDGPMIVKRMGIVLTVLAASCLLSTQSRAGLVAFIAGLLAVAWIIRSKLSRVVAGIVTICLFVAIPIGLYVKSSSGPGAHVEVSSSVPLKTGVATIVHRFDIWRFTLSKIAKHWIAGIGYGGQTYLLLYGQEGEEVTPGHTSVKDRGTHNIILYLSLHVGLAGMVLFVWFYFSAIRTTIREYKKAGDWTSKMVLAGMAGSMIGLFVRLQFDQMFVGSLALLFWVILAVCVAYYPSFRDQVPGDHQHRLHAYGSN